ncbi:phospholipase A2 inhibitor and Ly6/PLAUR domain-containing protein-like [Tiliqua scincoides]|uniref:phospholipase A2 inhibitor and Ly6/PLAUR domain-containing protein-like n=1 Tax=Tiliqua scincoides TaxID=71010 RepID=UPI0034619A8B
MQTLLGLFFCFVLITTGTALECEVCSDNSNNCTGRLQTCEAGQDRCAAVLTASTLVGFQIITIYKTCVSSSDCSIGPKYMNFGPGKEIRSSTTCCVGNACRPANPQLPPAITRPNGKWCPACYTGPSNSNDREKVNCFGPENQCLDMMATITYGTSVVRTTQRACVTQSICDGLKTGKFEQSGFRISIIEAECKPAPTVSS